jgi:hypothetical protein
MAHYSCLDKSLILYNGHSQTSKQSLKYINISVLKPTHDVLATPDGVLLLLNNI